MPSVDVIQPANPPPEEEEEEPEELSWNLGFVEEPEKPHLLLRHRFPSKVGGRPAWLDPVHLPPREMLTCGASGRPLDFLLQVYAPVDANPVDAFHRTLFLFISPEGSRLTQPGAVRLLRCQLPRNNPFYPPEPARERDKYPPLLKPSELEASRERDPFWRSVDAERPAASPSPASAGPSASSPASKRKGGRGGAAAAAAAAARAAAAAADTASAAGGLQGGATSSASAAGGPGAAAAAAAAPLPRVGVRGPGGLYPEYELVVEAEAEFEEEEE
ncbi:hypothetical protein Agub_g2803, partial [Astrephomene gubernaculifera]